MAVSDVKKLKKYPDPKNSSPMVTFYLERQQFMDPGKEYSITVGVNGYNYSATFGKSQTLPADVVAVLKNAKSALHPSANAATVELARGGEGRPMSQLMDSTQSLKYINDYNVVIEKEG
jgi:hypothetical protein